MTIKTSGGKVITKGGKVSCSCCEEPDCCMYPASGLGVTYEAADLPDNVKLTFLTASSLTLTRSGTSYGPESTGGVSYKIVIVPGGGAWGIEVDGILDGESFFLCLIIGDGNLTPGDDLIEDQFEPTYTISGGTSGTVTRVSLCEWTGVDSEGDLMVLSYLNPPYFDGYGDSFLWSLVATFQNEGFPLELSSHNTVNNTPEGSYTANDGTPGVFTVS